MPYNQTDSRRESAQASGFSRAPRDRSLSVIKPRTISETLTTRDKIPTVMDETLRNKIDFTALLMALSPVSIVSLEETIRRFRDAMERSRSQVSIISEKYSNLLLILSYLITLIHREIVVCVSVEI